MSENYTFNRSVGKISPAAWKNVSLVHLCDVRELACKWPGCVVKFDTSCRTRKYCDAHRLAAKDLANVRKREKRRGRKA